MQNKKSVRAAVYVRMSSYEFANGHNDHDFKRHEEKCVEFCRVLGYTLDPKHIYKEIASGVSADNRPVLLSMLEAAESKEFDVVVIYRIDRLARSLRVLLNIVDRLDSFSVGIKSVTEPFDTSTPIGKMTFSMMGAMAEYECSYRRNSHIEK